MILAHNLTMEQKQHVKELKKRMEEAETEEEREKLEKQLYVFLERVFLEFKLRRRNEL